MREESGPPGKNVRPINVLIDRGKFVEGLEQAIYGPFRVLCRVKPIWGCRRSDVLQLRGRRIPTLFFASLKSTLPLVGVPTRNEAAFGVLLSHACTRFSYSGERGKIDGE